ncbi:unnamed protein product [Sphagnum jensenii]|uniref:peptidyl-tRNA hydrolase n=1 Tax=Sphagnum jensenii TaxID=128206 RepID=A0ABP1A5T2_9BRYO
MPIGRGSSAASRKETRTKETWLSRALSPASLLPGMVIGFFLGLWVELPKGGFSQGGSSPSSSYEEHHPKQRHSLKSKKGNAGERKLGNLGSGSSSSSSLPPESADDGGELRMVFVVRQDLKMGSGKIASQCAHAAVGIYHELLSRQRVLLKKWEDCGQPKIVVTCKNQHELNELRSKAERVGLPTFTVADAGRTQVAAGSKTVLVIGPGSKASVDAITRHLRLL